MTALSRTRSRRRRPLAVAAAALLAVPACSSDDPAPAAGSAAPTASAATPSAVPTGAPSSPAVTSGGGATAGSGETDVCSLLTDAEVGAMMPGAGPGRPQGPGTCTWGAAPRSLTVTVGGAGSAAGGALPPAANDAIPLVQGVRIGGGGRAGEIAVGDRVCTVEFGTGVPAAAAAGYVVATAVRVKERYGA